MRINSAGDLLLRLDRRAVDLSVSAVAMVSAADLDRRTPCAAWSLADLLRHMTVQHHGFAAAAAGERSGAADWAPGPLGPDPILDYVAAARRVVEAFAGHVPDRGFWLPEIGDGGPFPAAMAISMHLVDYVVHTWDVMVSIGAEVAFDDDLTAAALEVAEQVPGGESRVVDGAAFKPARTVPPGSSPRQRLLLVLGRDPDWIAV